LGHAVWAKIEISKLTHITMIMELESPLTAFRAMNPKGNIVSVRLQKLEYITRANLQITLR
jgi:hypothetical protein